MTKNLSSLRKLSLKIYFYKNYNLKKVEYFQKPKAVELDFKEERFEFLAPSEFKEIDIKEKKIEFIQTSEPKDLKTEERSWNIVL